MEETKKNYKNHVDDMENEKEKLIKEAYDKADEIVKNMQQKAKALVDKIQKEEMNKEEAKQAQKSLNMLRNSLIEEKKKTIKQNPKKIIDINFEVGEKIFVKSLNQEGIIVKIKKGKSDIQVQAGILKLMVPISDIKKIEKKKKKNSTKMHILTQKIIKREIDLRGMTIDEAVVELDMYLDGAMLNSFNEVHIIHGKGTGKLRIGIQKHLKISRSISDYRDGNMNEGGLGVTIGTIK